MLMADTMAWFFGILGLMLALPALWLLCRGIWPSMVDGATADCARGLFVPFLCGLPAAIVTFIVLNVFPKAFGAVGGPLAAAGLCVFVMYASIGVAGLTTTIGQRLPSPVDVDRPWKATIRGGIVLELAFLLPFLGWFGLLPISLIIGAGCTTRGLFRSGRELLANWSSRKTVRHGPMATSASASVSIPDISFDGTVGA